MGIKLYGTEHIIFILLFIITLAVLVVLTKKYIKTDKRKEILLKIISVILLVMVIINRISIAIRNNNILYFFPETYCGLTSFVLSISVLVGKKDLKIFHFLCYIGFIGGLATVFYPNFLGQADSIFYLPTISGLLHHSIITILIVLLTETGWFVPTIKNWKVFPLGLGIYTLIGLFEIDVFNFPDAMQINTPIIAGTFLNWWFILIFGSLLLYGILFIVEIIRKRKSSNNL